MPRADRTKIDVRLERHLARVHAQNLLAPLEIGIAHGDLTIEAAGPQERGVEDVGAVGRRHDDDAVVLREAVHLDEQLVQRLLALLVAERIAAAIAPDRVELVDEDDARAVTARLPEQLADARCADAGVHLDEVGAAGRNEWARPPRRPSNAPAASCPCRAARPAECPRGMRPPIEANRPGSFRKSTISATSSFASSTPATSLNVTVTCCGSIVRAFSSVGTRPVTTRKSASAREAEEEKPMSEGAVAAGA